MKEMNESLLYGISDVLQTPLHVVGNGYKVKEPRKIKIGAWELATDIQVKSDVLDKDLASFWVHVIGDLWVYAISYANGNSVKLIVFSGAAAKLPKGLMATPCEDGQLKHSLAVVKAAGGLAYKYDNKKDEWVSSTFDI